MLFLVVFYLVLLISPPVLCLLDRVAIFHLVLLFVGLLGLDHFDQLLEVLRYYCPVTARTLDVDDILLVDVPLLHELSRRWGHLGARKGGRLRGGRLEVLHVLEQDLALGTRALHLGDVEAVVPCELLSARRGVDLSGLRPLSEFLQVRDGDLVVVASALELGGDLDSLGLGEVFGRLRCEARHLLLLGLLRHLLREVALGGQQGNRGVTVSGLGLHELVDDAREGLRGGGHGFGCRFFSRG